MRQSVMLLDPKLQVIRRLLTTGPVAPIIPPYDNHGNNPCNIIQYEGEILPPNINENDVSFPYHVDEERRLLIDVKAPHYDRSDEYEWLPCPHRMCYSSNSGLLFIASHGSVYEHPYLRAYKII